MRMVSPSNDTSVIAILRLTLDAVFTDHRFFVRQSMSACQVAGYILTLVRQGERDLDLLKASAFKKFSGAQPVQLSLSDSLLTATSDTGRRSETMQ
jgi:hypothetical protein